MNSVWFVLVILVMVSLQNFLYRKYIFKNIKIEREFEDIGIFPGDTVGFRFTITNKKPLPITWMTIQEKFSRALTFEVDSMSEYLDEEYFTHNITLSILPYQKINRRYRVKCLKRGYYELGELILTSTNILGTENYSLEMDVPVGVSVYPNIRDLSRTLLPANTTSGDFFVNRWVIDDPMMIIGIRDYVPTDSLRSINWKATAKNQKLQVNKYDYTADKKIMVIAYMERPEYLFETSDGEAFEKAIEVAASLALMLEDAGIPVGAATNTLCLGNDVSGVLEPAVGEKHGAALLEMFSRISYYKRFGAGELLSLLAKNFSWGTEIILVATRVTEALILELRGFGGIRITLIATESAYEGEVPANIHLYHYCEEGEKNAADPAV